MRWTVTSQVIENGHQIRYRLFQTIIHYYYSVTNFITIIALSILLLLLLSLFTLLVSCPCYLLIFSLIIFWERFREVKFIYHHHHHYHLLHHYYHHHHPKSVIIIQITDHRQFINWRFMGPLPEQMSLSLRTRLLYWVPGRNPNFFL